MAANPPKSAQLRSLIPGLAPEGARIPLVLLCAAVVLYLVHLHVPALLALIATALTAWFFRDPERTPPLAEGLVLSAADGKVVDIGEGPAPHDPQGRYRRVAVFMSPLNVHVNRAPVAGEVVLTRHTPGEFLAAFNDHASERNERNLVVLADRQGRHHAIVQVAGYLARRIVCRVHPHDALLRGQRLGLIMFGSRVDHFFPAEYTVMVRIGQHIKAGETVIGELAQ